MRKMHKLRFIHTPIAEYIIYTHVRGLIWIVGNGKSEWKPLENIKVHEQIYMLTNQV